MYAIIEAGGKQYRVREGDEIRVERLKAAPEAEVAFDRVLAVGEGRDLITGTPTVSGARVIARVLEEGRSRKVLVFKYKPKVNYRRRQGHRQAFSRVRIERIETPAGDARRPSRRAAQEPGPAATSEPATAGGAAGAS